MRNHPPVLARSVLFLIIMLFASAPVAADSECLEFVGRWPFGGAEGIAVVGDYAYFGAGFALVAVNISQHEPRVVATLDVGGAIWHMEAAGDSLYVGVHISTATSSEASSIRLFNIANPEAPVELPLSGLGLEGYVRAFTITGHRLAVSFRHQDPLALRLFDITSPESPE